MKQKVEKKKIDGYIHEDEIVSWYATMGEDDINTLRRTMGNLEQGDSTILGFFETAIKMFYPASKDLLKFLKYSVQYKLSEQGTARKDIAGILTGRYTVKKLIAPYERERDYEEEEEEGLW